MEVIHMHYSNSFNWKQFFYYILIALAFLFLYSLISFYFFNKHSKVVQSVSHCIQPTDIFLHYEYSKFGNSISITDKLDYTDFIIRNKKQIPIKDICN